MLLAPAWWGSLVVLLLTTDGLRTRRVALLGGAAAVGLTLGIAAGAVRETTYVGVGFTVLGIQRLQVRRRDLERALRR
jgi:hypothetical protein